MSNQNVNYSNLDARYTKPTDVDTKIATQATTDAAQYAVVLKPEKFGAVGDGTTDDTTALQSMFSAIPSSGAQIVLTKKYLTHASLSTNNPVSIRGVGAMNPSSNAITSGFLCATDGIDVLAFGGNVGQRTLRDFAIMWTGALGAATSGSAIKFAGTNGGDFFNMENVHLAGFYDNLVVQAGFYYHVTNCYIVDGVRSGAYLSNSEGVDKGDNGFFNCVIGKRLSTTAGGIGIKWESGGGLRVVGCKFNANSSGLIADCISLNCLTGATSVFLITGNSFEGYTGAGIRIQGGAAASLSKIGINANEFFPQSSGWAIVADGTGMTKLTGLTITANNLTGSNGISLTSCQAVTVLGNSGADLTGTPLALSGLTAFTRTGNIWPSGKLSDNTSTQAGSYIDFSAKSNGTPPGLMDTGQVVTYQQTATGNLPLISSGQLVVGSGASSSGTNSYADYYQANLGAAGVRVGTRYVWPANPTTNGTMCIALWGGAYQASMGQNVPTSIAHLTITPRTGTTGTWSWYVSDGIGHLFVVKTGSYTNPATDGAAIWYTDIIIDQASNIGYAILPDGQVVTVSAAEVAAAFTSAGYTPVTFATLAAASSFAMIEHYATANGGSSVYPQFLDFWAETQAAPAFSRAVTPSVLTKTLRQIALSAPSSPTSLVYAPTTADTVATTTSAAFVDAANIYLAATAGPTGGVIVDVRAYYEFSAADTLYWRVRESNGGTTSTVRAAFISTGTQKELVDQMVIFSGFTAGQSLVLTLQHWTITAGTATFKAGGTGAAMLPPITIKATPV